MGILAQFLGPFHPRRMVSLIRTRGPGTARQRQVEQDAAADVAAIEQDDKYFSPDAPANQDDLLPGRGPAVPGWPASACSPRGG